MGRLALITAAVAALLVPACSPGAEPAPGHPAARLPEACHSLLCWNHAPQGAVHDLFAELLGPRVPGLFLEGPGMLAGWTDPRTGASATVVQVQLPEVRQPDARIEALRRDLPEDRVLELAGRELWLLPAGLAGFTGGGWPVLGPQRWFREGVAGLDRSATDELEVEMHFDLQRLQDIARQTRREQLVAGLSVLPGIEGFLGLSLAFRPSVSAERGQIDLFVRLASHPLGIAAALDVVPERMLPTRLPGLAEASGFVRIDFRMGTFMDALKQRLFGERGQAGEVAAGISPTLGILLQNELWRGFGDEWVLVDPEGTLGAGGGLASSGAFAAAALTRAEDLRRSLKTLAQAGRLLGRDVEISEVAEPEPMLVVDASMGGLGIVLAIGPKIGGMGPSSAREALLGLVRTGGEAGPLRPLADMPPAPEGGRLEGLGRWSLGFLEALLPEIDEEFRPFVQALVGDGRRMRFHLWRVERGFQLQGRW